MDRKSLPFELANLGQIEHVAGSNRRFLIYGPRLMAVKVWFEEGAVGCQYEPPQRQDFLAGEQS